MIRVFVYYDSVEMMHLVIQNIHLSDGMRYHEKNKIKFKTATTKTMILFFREFVPAHICACINVGYNIYPSVISDHLS